MRSLIWIFLIISLIVHLVLLGFINLDTQKKQDEKPIQVSIIPKEKKAEKPKAKPAPEIKKIPLPEPKPQPKELPKPEAKPKPAPKPQPQPRPQRQPNFKDFDEDLPSDMGQKKPVFKEKGQQKKPQAKGKDAVPKDNTHQDSLKQTPQKQTPPKQGPVPTPTPGQGMQKSRDTDLPKMSSKSDEHYKEDRQTAEQKKLDDIMNPKDVIEKYAMGEGSVTNEDSVSMQYVKMKYQSYFYKFARRLYQVWQYPIPAGRRGEQGTVQASFVISRVGDISNIRILRSSGYPDLDNEVMYALKNMSGVPLPDSYKLNELKVDAYFRYVINDSYIYIY